MIRALLLVGLLTAETEIPATDDQPSLELLEFLGSFETDDGEWLDPLILDDVGEQPGWKRIDETDTENSDADPDHLDRPDGDGRDRGD